MTYRVAILITSYCVIWFRISFYQGFQNGPSCLLGGHEQQSGKRGAMSSKGTTGGPWGHNLNLTLSLVVDEEQKKKVLSVFYGSLWVIVLKGAIAFITSLRGATCKKVWETMVYTKQVKHICLKTLNSWTLTSY